MRLELNSQTGKAVIKGFSPTSFNAVEISEFQALEQIVNNLSSAKTYKVIFQIKPKNNEH